MRQTLSYALPAFLVFVSAASTLAASAAAQGTAPPTASEPTAPDATLAGLKLILLRPSLRFEDVRTTFAVQSTDQAEYEYHLLDAARKRVGPSVRVLGVDKIEPPAAEACGRLDALASRLARGDVNEEAAEGLSRLGALDDRYAVLVQFLRVKTGPGRSWDPNTGAITSSMASTLMQAALLSAKTGKVLWKGERLVRNRALRPGNAVFDKELALLYRDFDIK